MKKVFTRPFFWADRNGGYDIYLWYGSGGGSGGTNVTLPGGWDTVPGGGWGTIPGGIGGDDNTNKLFLESDDGNTYNNLRFVSDNGEIFNNVEVRD